jgi:nitrogen regulatory protein P-II 1
MQLGNTRDVSLNKIEAIVQTDKLACVKSALAGEGITILRFSLIQCATTLCSRITYCRGVNYVQNFVERLKIEIVAPEQLTDSVVKLIVQAAGTEAVEDVEVLVIPIAQAVRIATNEIPSRSDRGTPQTSFSYFIV